MGSLKDLLAKAGQGATITLTASHKETINMGNYESVSPFVSMSLSIEDPTVDPDEIYLELKAEVAKAFEDSALEHIRDVVERRRAINKDTAEPVANAKHFKSKC